MSKNNHKIIGSIFFVIFLIFISLSFYKIQFSDSVEQDQEQTIDQEIIELDKKEEVSEVNKESQSNDFPQKNINENYIEGEFSFELIINGERSSYSFNEDQNLFEIMEEMRNYGQITFEAKDFSGLGAYVYSINGISENKKEGLYWIYYINDEVANIGVSNYILKDGDQIKWQLENNTY